MVPAGKTQGMGIMRIVAGLLALAALAATTPAVADVKAGIDAWNHGDFTRAVAEWRPLAINGNADAQFNLGLAYKFGRGVPIDAGQALAWFKRAADQGHVQAEDNYGIGLFQANRRTEAQPYLERSVKRGEPRAQLLLATMLFNGDNVAIDYPRAYALMTRASQAGLPSAAQSLAQMDGFITPADRARGKELIGQYPAAIPYASTPVRPTAAPAAAPAVKPTPVRPVAVAAAPPAPKPTPARPVAVAPRPAPPRSASPPRPAATSGPWRVQLGAFRDRGNADALWSKVRARVGGQPAFVAGGGITRLQATGFANRAAAQRACSASQVSCVVIAP